ARAPFLLALRLTHDYASAGGDLSGAFAANSVLNMTMEAWHGLRAAEVDGVITLGDAVGALSLIEHMLRPLSVSAPEVDLVHCSMNGLSSLVGMTAKWRHGVPLVMSEHGIYLRERYLGYLDDDAPHAVKVLLLSFF